MFEIKSINELLYPTVTSYGSIKNQFRFVETHRYIDAANAEIKRLQSQPATFDNIPWEPVTLEALDLSEKGLYEFKTMMGEIWIIIRHGFIWQHSTSGTRWQSNDISNLYIAFRKLPIPLHTPAPERPKRYEVGKSLNNEYVVWDNQNECHFVEVNKSAADLLCDKLNRLEELEAKE